MTLALLSTPDLFIAIGGFIFAAGALLLLARLESHGPERKRPEPVEPWYPAEEIRVRDLTRRGPKPIEHHHGKQRVGL